MSSQPFLSSYYLQLVTKVLRRCTQIGELQRTKEFTPSLLASFKVGVLVVKALLLQGGDGGGIPLLKPVKCQKAPLG